MKVGSLFSGIGGFDLGLERAGFTIEWQVENNDYCRKVLQKHWPAVPCHYDIKTIDWRDIPQVDLVCGGFPCQPFSLAGKRRGAEDDRYLWPEVVRCLSELQPTWFLGENVPGIINLALDQVCIDLESIGYSVWPVCLPACSVDAPHIRNRIWIVAYHASAVDGKSIARTGQGSVQQSGECSISSDVPDAQGMRRRQGNKNARGNGERTRTKKKRTGPTDFRWWSPEPAICRVVDGIPNRSHRLKGLGNAIVPQIAEAIGRMILLATP